MALDTYKPTFVSKNPLVGVALSLMVGMAFADQISLEYGVLLCVVGALFFAFIYFRRAVLGLSLPATVLAFGGLGLAMMHLASLHPQPSVSTLSVLHSQQTFVGRVGLGQYLPDNKYATTLSIEAFQTPAGWQWVSGKINLRIKNEEVPSPGARVQVNGFYVPNHPEQGDPFWEGYRRYLHKQLIAGSLYATYPRATWIVVAPPQQLDLPFVWAQKAARTLTHAIDATLGITPEGGVAKALLLGTREGLTPEIQQAYRAGGAIHLLVVSGGHLGLLWGIFFYVLKWLPPRWQGQGRWAGRLTIVLLLWVFAFITGLGPSMVRAALMLTLLEIGNGFGRPTTGINALSGACIVLLIVDPLSFNSLGFQLSVACVAGLIVLGPKVEALYTPTLQITRIVWKAFASTIAAQMAAIPLILLHFGQVPVWFWLANPPAILLTGLLLPGLLALLALQAAVAWLGFGDVVCNAYGSVLRVAIHGLNSWMEAVGALPGAVQDGWYIATGQAVVIAFALVWLVTVPRGIGMWHGRYALGLAFLWCVVSVFNLAERASTTRGAIGYDSASGFYAVHQTGLHLQAEKKTNEAKQLAFLWNATLVNADLVTLPQIGALRFGATVLVADKRKTSKALQAQIKQNGWELYDLHRQRFFVTKGQ